MNKKQYAIYDTTAMVFLNSVTFLNHGEAIRWLTSVVNDDKQETNIAKYPSQFSLWYLGTFDDETGKTENKDREEVIQASSVKDSIPTFTVQQLMTALDKRYENNVVEFPTQGEKQ